MSTPEADYGLTQMALDEQHSLSNQYAGDEKLYVRFYLYPTHDPDESAEEGRPIFKDVEWVHIQIPGDRNNIVQRPAHDLDKQRFAKRYDEFKRNAQEATSGTMLEHWPRISRAQVEELKYFGCRTVEQLAGMSDTQAQKFPGINILRQWARDFLEQAKATAGESLLRKELDTRDSEIAALKKAVADLSARVAQQEEDEDEPAPAKKGK